MHSNLAYILISLIVGFGIPIGATLNAGLATRIGSPIAAALCLFFVGATIASNTLAVSRTAFSPSLNVPPLSIFYFGGVFIAAYVLSITWLVPRFGIGNAVFVILLGQMISALALDHFGWFGVPQKPADLSRLFGVVVMLVGVLLVTKAGRP